MATFTSGCLFMLKANGLYVIPAINNDGNKTVANMTRFHKGNAMVESSVKKITDAIPISTILRI